MEQIGLALILFAAFWVGGAAAYIAMRQRAQAAYEKGGIDAAAEISTLTERLTGRDLQITEARQRAEAAAETIIRLEAELRAAAGEAITRLQNTAASDMEQRQSLFGQVMEPLKSSLDRVDSRIGMRSDRPLWGKNDVRSTRPPNCSVKCGQATSS